MGTALIVSLLAGLGIVLLLVVAVILDRWTLKAANGSTEQRSRAERTEDPRDEFLE